MSTHVLVSSVSREELLNELSKTLTIYEAASLVSRISERDRSQSGMSKSERFGLYPIHDWDAYKRTKELEASFWTADEVDFTSDRNDFNEFTTKKQWPLIMAFGFFAVGDGSITSMLAYKMILIAPSFEDQSFYVAQLHNECTHGETYGQMIYTLVSDPLKRKEILDAVDNVKSIREMNEYIEHSITYPDGKRQCYVSLAAVEYIMFTPLFCIIFWYRAYQKGKIQQIIFSNEQIAKDECIHCENSCVNYRKLPSNQRYTNDEIHSSIDCVVKLVCNFADEVLAEIELPELTAQNVKQYVKFVADDLFYRLDHSKYYNVENPFLWMNLTTLVPKTNFYEGTVGEYSRFNVNKSIERAKLLCSAAAPKPIKKRNKF